MIVSIGEKSQILAAAKVLKVPLNLMPLYCSAASRIITINKFKQSKISAIRAARMAFAEIVIQQSFGFLPIFVKN